MRLAVLIPAHNEAQSIADVISRIPRSYSQIDTIDIVVVDDGSTDDTQRIARAAGAVTLSHTSRAGLAAAFRTGLSYALKHDADLIATLDADGQYMPEELPRLISALIDSCADLVVGDRQISRLLHMPIMHRIGNEVGSFMLRILGTTSVKDASSGFRVFSRAFGLQLRILSEHTYTHEMLIQASAAQTKIVEVPVTFLPRKHGKSKLVRTLRHHIFRSCGTILKALFLYAPLRKFLMLSGLFLIVSIAAFAIFLLNGFSISDLVLPAICLVFSIQFLVIGLIADAQASARKTPPQIFS